MCVLLSLCRDANDTKRSVSHISWFPDGPRKLAVAYSRLEFQIAGQTSKASNINSYIWDIGKTVNPKIVLLRAVFIIKMFWHVVVIFISVFL